jgi:hypothetical protein
LVYLPTIDARKIEYDDIVKITTVTGDDPDSGMDMSSGSSIDIEVYGHYGELECKIYRHVYFRVIRAYMGARFFSGG